MTEEVAFPDGERKCLIDAIAQISVEVRTSLNQPVESEAIYYRPDAAAIMPRLQTEFPRALQGLSNKNRFDGPAKAIKFPLLALAVGPSDR
ncbi:MAG TPA: hypothetical protein VGP12_11025, partial [Nitrosospira sp.]|nr:hypothetical protein [Nitrosospira sp.]